MEDREKYNHKTYYSVTHINAPTVITLKGMINLYNEAKAFCPNCDGIMLSEDIDRITRKFYGDDSMGIIQYHRNKSLHFDVPECEYICPNCGYIFEGSEITLLSRFEDDIEW